MAWEKFVNLVNCELFAKIFLVNIHRYTKNALAYALTVAYLPKFSSPIAFTCMVCQNFPPPNISHVWYYYVFKWTSCSLMFGKKLFSIFVTNEDNSIYVIPYYVWIIKWYIYIAIIMVIVASYMQL